MRQEEAAQERDSVKFLAADAALHLALVRLGGNRRLVTLAGNYLDHFRRMGMQRLMDEEQFGRAIEEHRAIIKALASGDIAWAEEEFTMHLDHTREVLLADLSPGGGQS